MTTETARYRFTKVIDIMTPWYRDCDSKEELYHFLKSLDGPNWKNNWEVITPSLWHRYEDGKITHTVEALDRETTFDVTRISLFWLDILEDLKSGELVTVPAQGIWKVKNGVVQEVTR